MKISVVIAAYKGEKYIAEQLGSILPQLGADDEIIVSDDYPEGKTKEAVMSVGDSRIKYTEGPGKGVTENFGYAMSLAKGDVIFLCDQDDVWMPDKVQKVTGFIEKGFDLVLHDAQVTDAKLNMTEPSFFALHGTNLSLISNLVRNGFVGCCMAFTKELMHAFLPLPRNIPMHDWWIGVYALKAHYSVKMLKEPLIKWRRHGDNVTGAKTSALQKIRWRVNITADLISRMPGKDRKHE
ncbi:MAG: glycosyltransferase [Clostridia bacterium]|nr:glycosyltransferase [Clostridia bacterium]